MTPGESSQHSIRNSSASSKEPVRPITARIATMAYTITSQAKNGALDARSAKAPTAYGALRKARQMHAAGLQNIAIKNDAGHRIDGDALLDCITGKKSITPDLKAK